MIVSMTIQDYEFPDLDPHSEWDEVSDEDLIRKMHEDSGIAKDIVEYLLQRHKNLARVKSKSYFMAGADNSDLIQEGMIGLYKAITDYQEDRGSSFRSFADLCVSRNIISAVKASSRMKNLPLNSYVSFDKEINDDGEREMTLEDALSSDQPTPEEYVIDKESAILLQKEIDEQLSSMEKTVLAYHMNGLDYHKIAQILEKPDKSIDNALQRIKKKVQKIADDHSKI